MSPWYVGRIVSGYAEGFPYESTGWKYKVFTPGSEPDASQPDFDDSAWDIGQAPFGYAVGYQGDALHAGYPYAKTFWPLQTMIWARRRVSGAGVFNVSARYDNEAWVYWNGTLIHHGSGNISTTPTFQMTSSGSGVLAIKCLDYYQSPGGANYLDGRAELA